MGWCGVEDPVNIPPIWFKYQTTKSVATHRMMLMEALQVWARDHGNVRLDPALFLTEASIGDWVNLRMNPGSARPRYESCDKGMTPLAARPMSVKDKESHELREQAKLEARADMTFMEVVQDKKSDPPAPAQTYDKLCKNVITYAAILGVHFGNVSGYYKNVVGLKDILELEVVASLEENFTPKLCREITWAVIDDGRFYFSKQVTPNQLATGQAQWPMSNLDCIFQNVRYQSEIHRSTFPTQWLAQTAYEKIGKKTGMQHQGGAVRNLGGAFNLHLAPPQVQNPFVQDGNTKIGNKEWTPPQNDPRHPIIRRLMDPLLKQCRGKWSLRRILEGANIAIKDLPQIPKYMVNGQNTLCYRMVLDHCKSKRCANQGGHEVERLHVSDEYAKALSARIAPGVQHVLSNPGAGLNATGSGGGRKRGAPG